MTNLIVAYSFAIVDRSIVSLLVQPIKSDLGATDAQIGLLQGLAFAICYTTFGFPLGFATDRTDRRLLLAGGIFIWSAATIACGFAPNFPMLFISRIFVGLGEACVLPVAGSLIADYFPPVKRAQAYGFLMLSGTFGILAGNLIGGNAIGLATIARTYSPAWIRVLHNWQIVFLIIGLPGVAISAIFALTVREPLRRETSQAAGFLLVKPLVAHARLNWSAYGALLCGSTLNMLCIYAQVTWAPTFLIRVYHWSPEKVGLFLVAPSIIGASSAFSVGYIMSWLIAKGHVDAPLIAILFHAGICLILGPLVYLAPKEFMMVPLYLVMASTANWSASAAMMGISQIAPNELRGRVIAFYTAMTGLVSLSAGAYAVGMLSDRFFPWPNGLRWSLAVVYAIAGGVAVLLAVVGRSAYRAAVQRSQAWAESRT